MKKFLICAILFVLAACLVSCGCKEHIFTPFETTIAPTCTEAGVETRFCESCKYSEEQALEMLGHTFGDWVELTVPNCTDPYDASHSCTVCGFSETQTMGPKGHTYDLELYSNSFVHEHPSCFKEGVAKDICIVCNDPDDVLYRPIKKMEHRWEGGDCLNPSYCIYCYTKGPEPTGHDWSQSEYICSRCGYVMGLGQGSYLGDF